mgnify:CR=1 FL=1
MKNYLITMNRKRNLFLIFTVVCLSCLYIILTESINLSKNKLKLNSIKSNKKYIPKVWENTPELTLMTRLYHGAVLEYYNTFLVGYHLFWPHRSWKNSDLTIILDNESEEDHKLATVLGNF